MRKPSALATEAQAIYDTLPQEAQQAAMNYVRFVHWRTVSDPKLDKLLGVLTKAGDGDACIPAMDAVLAHRPGSWLALVAKARAIRESPLDVNGTEADVLINDILALSTKFPAAA